MAYISFISIMLLVIISYQDFKERQIYWALFPLVAASIILESLLYKPTQSLFHFLPANFFIIIVELLFVLMYIKLKSRGSSNFFNNIGLGDILFLMILSISLSTVNLLVFLIIALIITLISWETYKKILSKKGVHIPLCGFLAIQLATVFLIDYCLPSFNRYHDLGLINLVN